MGMRYQPLSAALRLVRDSEKKVRGPDGELAPVGADVPGFDHDGLGRARGLLIEGAATNLLRYSTAFDNALWEKDGGVSVTANVAANVALAPDGSMTASQLDLPDGTAGLYQATGGLNAGGTYALSVWMRAVAGTADVTLGGIDGASAHAVALDENWQRVTVVEAASGTTRYPKISTAVSAAPASILIWNAQLEAGACATSDIVSDGIPAARAGDDVRVDPGDWFRAGAGTFVFDLETAPGWMTGGLWRIVQLYSTSLNDDHLDLAYDTTADQLRISLRKEAIPLVTQSLYGALSPDTRARIALCWDDDVIAVALNGTVRKSPDGFAIPRNFSNIVLGAYDGASGHLNGHLRNLAYWPARLSDARLSVLSML